MYPVSNNYKTAIAARSVISEWYGTIDIIGVQDPLPFNQHNLDQAQSRLVSEYTQGDTLSIGTAFSSQVTIVLRGEYDRYKFYGGTIHLYFKLYIPSIDDYEIVPCGTFTITDAKFTYHTVTLTAYDNMQKFSGKNAGLTDAEPYSGLVEICTACGVTLGNTQAEIEAMTNGTEELAFSSLETTVTYRDIVGYVAAILCGNAVIGRDGCLYIKNYSNTAVRTITDANRYSSTYIDYIGRYNRLALTDGEGNEQTYTASGTYTETLLTMSIGTNPLLNVNENIDTMAQDIIDELVGIVYAPCTITMPQDPSLDIGDAVTVSGGNIETPIRIILTRQDIKLFGQTQVISAGGDYKLQETRTRSEYTMEMMPVKLNQTEQKLQEEIAEITYDYIDPQTQSTSPIGDGQDAIVLAFYFHLESATRVRFGSTINFETAKSGTDLVHLHVIYNVDNTELNPNNPLIQYYDDGHHILTLDFLTAELAAGDHSFGVAFGVTGGTVS